MYVLLFAAGSSCDGTRSSEALEPHLRYLMSPIHAFLGASEGAKATTPPVPEKVDVLITSTSCQQDVALATLIKGNTGVAGG